MLAWMLYVIMVTLLLSVGAYVAERAARLKRGRTRWIWITAIVASLALPTVIASVSVQLPNIMSPAVAREDGGAARCHHAGALARHVDLGQRRGAVGLARLRRAAERRCGARRPSRCCWR